MECYDTGGDEFDTFLHDADESAGEAVKPWDSFKILHKKPDVGSTVESKWIENGVKALKVCTLITVFIVVLIAAVLSKTTLLFMTSQVKNNATKAYCNKYIDVDREYVYTNSDVERTTWIWLITFAYVVPEIGTFLRSIRILIFKTWVFPETRDFLGRLGIESFSAIGSALFVFGVLPEIDVIKGAMLTNAMCLIPSIGSVLNTRRFQSNSSYRIIIDILAIMAQLSACIIWPVTQNRPVLYLIPVSVILISLGWWENFFPEKIVTYFLNQKDQPKTDLAKNMYFTYSIVSVTKCLLFLATTLIYFYLADGKCIFLFTQFSEAFSQHPITITEVQFQIDNNDAFLNSAISTGVIYQNYNDTLFNIIIFLINITATYICYAFGKFGCKIMIQIAGFALPINLTVPILLTLLICLCGPYMQDKCIYFDTYTPAYLFFNVPSSKNMIGFLLDEYAWLWLLWLVSQIWITQHIWTNRNFVLSSTEELFLKPMYDAFLIDQSVALNRRNIKEVPTEGQDIELDKYDDTITRIYACATMWHETRSEMIDFLMSVMRMDEDQAARRIVKQYLQYPVESYYEWETHIFFDDAFVRKSSNDNDPNLNTYVMDLIDIVPEAASEVHKTKVRIKPPEIFPTPYGGRLVWTLPGKTKMIAHLKDKAKIRAKKRWSQVMYMYYLLGHRLMENDDFSPEEVKERSRNTYIMALDGDIDFQPDAVHLLVQCMKRNPSLGAACGRIHPVGSGLIAWYQIFEYAVGHWMQKATEHVIGCVLCSPGCFSLFRASALMDYNVMARYTTRSEEARHYVQYDQGEDRWLCTLLLQRGYRVEYAAASDAYTHCPEGFNEFYNQRRRWMPSTMANILDLLQDARHIIKENDDISRLYIFYQIVLMVGTVIGPGTIFLMLVGATVAVFQYAQWTAFLYNLIPIVSFVAVCMFCKSDIQLLAAAIISACYGILMMAVVIGVVMQIVEDGFLAPSPLFFFLMAGDYIVAALIHPKEFYCLKYGIIYLVTVPSMYMLLVIYSVFNMNNVSWGTREVTVVANNPGSIPKVQVKKKKESPLWLFILKIKDFVKQFLKPPLHHVMISNMLKHVEHRFDFLKRRIKRLEDIKVDPSGDELLLSRKSLQTGSVFMPAVTELNIQEADEEIEENDSWDASINGFNSNSWFYNGPLIWSQVTYLDRKEQTFWQDLLDKYLYPIEDNKAKVAKALKDLRDKIVMMFFFINSMFVLVVFLLTLKKNLIHLEWPFGAKHTFNYTNNKDTNEILLNTTYLQLEPIGFVFMIFFFGLLLIQFICMFLHRFATYSQIMANTSLDFNICSAEVKNMTKEELLNKDPVTIFRKLIRLRGVNGDEESENEINGDISRRSTVVNLVKNREKTRATINDLDTAFAVRMAKIREEGNCDVPVSTDNITAIHRRRTTVLRRQSQMPSNMQKVTFDIGPDPTIHYFDNNSYEDLA